MLKYKSWFGTWFVTIALGLALSATLSRAPGFGTSATLPWLCVPAPPPIVLAYILTLNSYLGFLVRILLWALFLEVPALSYGTTVSSLL